MDQDRACLIRFSITGEGNIFAGLTGSAALSFPSIDLSADIINSKTNLGVSGDGFAGIRGEAGIKLAAAWSKGQEKGKELHFESLANFGGKIGASAGMGALVNFEIQYKDDRFVFFFAAGITWGLGLKGSFSFEVEPVEGLRFVRHFSKTFDYHHLPEIAKSAFEFYRDFGIESLTVAVQSFEKSWHSLKGNVSDLKKSVNKESIAALKHRLVGPALSEQIYDKLLPETLGHTLKAIMTTREPDDFNHILKILDSTKSEHKFKWILRRTSDVVLLDRNDPHYDTVSGEALRAGIQKIQDFADGVGYPENKKIVEIEIRKFIKEFKNCLTQNGIQNDL